MPHTSSDPFALTRVVVARADYLIETSLDRAGFRLRLGELKVLRLIVHGCRTPEEIRKAIGPVTQQYISKCLTELATQGCIERSGDTRDRRRIAITVTKEGQRAAALCDAWYDRFDQLAPSALEAAAAKILRGFDQLVDTGGDLPVETPQTAR